MKDFEETETECKCPMCKCIHVVIMCWIGNGMPYKLCYNCGRSDTVMKYGKFLDQIHDVNFPKHLKPMYYEIGVSDGNGRGEEQETICI